MYAFQACIIEIYFIILIVEQALHSRQLHDVTREFLITLRKQHIVQMIKYQYSPHYNFNFYLSCVVFSIQLYFNA